MSIFNDGPLKATCYWNGAHQKLTRPLFAFGVINNNVRRSGPAVFIDIKKTRNYSNVPHARKWRLRLESISITGD